MGLTEDFQSAVGRSKQLPEKPSNDDLLKLYSLFKQATVGDVSGEKPGMFDFVAKAKFEAWEKLQGMTSEDAMQQYAALVEALEKQ